MKVREQYTCPLELTHDIIRGKWKPIILWQLKKEKQSLSDLKREIGGISQKMLLQHLGELTACHHVLSGRRHRSGLLRAALYRCEGTVL